MNAERLLAQFERISEAPDAIPRLRRFILDLAVRGKLVEQDPEDEPAGELLGNILIDSGLKSGKRKSGVSNDAVPSDPPFAAPETWAWTSLGFIGDWGSGSTPPRGQVDFYGGDISWFKSGELNDNKRLARSEETVTSFALEKCSFRLNRPGDVLIAMYGATIGKLAILAETAVTNQAVCACTPSWGVDNEYLFIFLLAQRHAFRQASEGGAQPNISKIKILQTPFPLPPLAEQHRIVAKVDELMALCDQLEAARQERQQGQQRLVAASLQRLNQPAEDPDTFRQQAGFALNALPRLTTSAAEIKQLRQTILNLAVRGKLVEQDPEDEPAIITITGALLTSDESPRRRARRKASYTPTAHTEDQELPVGWHRFSLAELVDPGAPLTYGVLVPGDNVPDGIPFVRAQDLMLAGHPELPSKRISPEIENKYARTRLKGGEILICVVGSIGKIGVVPACWVGANIARAVARLRLLSEIASPYIVLALQSDIIQGFFRDSTRTLAQPTLNISLIEATPIPLPPLAEQHRIVAKVDELMALCDQLEQQLNAGEQLSRKLLEAVVQEALAGRLPEKSEGSSTAAPDDRGLNHVLPHALL